MVNIIETIDKNQIEKNERNNIIIENIEAMEKRFDDKIALFIETFEKMVDDKIKGMTTSFNAKLNVIRTELTDCKENIQKQKEEIVESVAKPIEKSIDNIINAAVTKDEQDLKIAMINEQINGLTLKFRETNILPVPHMNAEKGSDEILHQIKNKVESIEKKLQKVRLCNTYPPAKIKTTEMKINW